MRCKTQGHEKYTTVLHTEFIDVPHYSEIFLVNYSLDALHIDFSGFI